MPAIREFHNFYQIKIAHKIIADCFVQFMHFLLNIQAFLTNVRLRIRNRRVFEIFLNYLVLICMVRPISFRFHHGI